MYNPRYSLKLVIRLGTITQNDTITNISECLYPAKLTQHFAPQLFPCAQPPSRFSR